MNTLLKKHPRIDPIVYHHKRFFRFESPREIYAMGKSFSESAYLKNGVRNIMLQAQERSGRKINEGTDAWKKAHNAIVRNYMKVMSESIIDTVLEGDRIIIGERLIGFHIFDMPPYMSVGNIVYKYHRKLSGQYPIMRVSVHERRLSMYSAARGIKKPAFYIGAGMTKLMSGMVTNKIISDRKRYSSNPKPSFIKQNIISNATKRNYLRSSASGS